MLLITMHEWIGPSSRWPENQPSSVVERTAPFATDLNLDEALSHIKAHQLAYNERYRSAVNFTLLGVTEIPEIKQSLLEFFKVEWVETLPTSPEDFNN